MEISQIEIEVVHGWSTLYNKRTFDSGRMVSSTFYFVWLTIKTIYL